MQATQSELELKGRAARAAARRLAFLSTDVKNAALHNVAAALLEREEEILAANRQDVADGRAAGLEEAFLDRLLLTHERLAAMASDVRTIAALPDPVGEEFDVRTLPNGLRVGRRRVPLGVIGTVYESRPNVTVDIACLCLKSGNAVILRGGKEALRSNLALGRVVVDAVTAAGVPEGAVQVVESPDRALVEEMLRLREYIDLMVPRGGAQLIRYVAEHAAMPVIAGGIGVCHTYVDADADVAMAVDVVHNAKTRRPSICNALDTVLVHSQVAPAFLPELARRWAGAGVELRCDRRAETILAALDLPGLRVTSAAPEDFGKEFLALIAAVRVVDSLDEALEHIERYGSGHSEAIVTRDYGRAMRFLNEVDAAAVYVNASTQFTDGGQFGLGAEVGISTGKFHARGPMGLRELTTYKWVILGNGQTRP
ncbi:MAG TPA: glutamate-5-semialdehyde dehydrogenase [Dehalococcoidia bacterium]